MVKFKYKGYLPAEFLLFWKRLILALQEPSNDWMVPPHPPPNYGW
jgi:hypothetical protein